MAEDTKKWDKDQEAEGIWSMAGGRSPTDAVWRQAFLAEKAQGTCRHVLTLLWDLKQAYENVGHALLAEEATRAGLPGPGLRMAIAMYRVPRVLMLDGACSQPVQPQRGIVAGSSTACHEIKAVMAPSVTEARRRCGQGPLAWRERQAAAGQGRRTRKMTKTFDPAFHRRGADDEEDQRLYIHVDDVAMEAVAASIAVVVRMLVQQAEEMAMVFQRLSLPLAWPKVALTGSSREAVHQAKLALGRLGGRPEAFIANLGGWTTRAAWPSNARGP